MHICSITHMHSVSTQPFCGGLDGTFFQQSSVPLYGIVPSARAVCDGERKGRGGGQGGLVKGWARGGQGVVKGWSMWRMCVGWVPRVSRHLAQDAILVTVM